MTCHVHKKSNGDKDLKINPFQNTLNMKVQHFHRVLLTFLFLTLVSYSSVSSTCSTSLSCRTIIPLYGKYDQCDKNLPPAMKNLGICLDGGNSIKQETEGPSCLCPEGYAHKYDTNSITCEKIDFHPNQRQSPIFKKYFKNLDYKNNHDNTGPWIRIEQNWPNRKELYYKIFRPKYGPVDLLGAMAFCRSEFVRPERDAQLAQILDIFEFSALRDHLFLKNERTKLLVENITSSGDRDSPFSFVAASGKSEQATSIQKYHWMFELDPITHYEDQIKVDPKMLDENGIVDDVSKECLALVSDGNSLGEEYLTEVDCSFIGAPLVICELREDTLRNVRLPKRTKEQFEIEFSGMHARKRRSGFDPDSADWHATGMGRESFEPPTNGDQINSASAAATPLEQIPVAPPSFIDNFISIPSDYSKYWFVKYIDERLDFPSLFNYCTKKHPYAKPGVIKSKLELGGLVTHMIEIEPFYNDTDLQLYMPITTTDFEGISKGNTKFPVDTFIYLTDGKKVDSDLFSVDEHKRMIRLCDPSKNSCRPGNSLQSSASFDLTYNGKKFHYFCEIRGAILP